MDSILRSLLVALPDDAASAKRIVRRVPHSDWPALFEHAIGHGVSGLLEPFLDAETVPAPIWKALLLHNTDDALSYRTLARSLEEIVSRLDGERIPRVCVEGARARVPFVR